MRKKIDVLIFLTNRKVTWLERKVYYGLYGTSPIFFFNILFTLGHVRVSYFVYDSKNYSFFGIFLWIWNSFLSLKKHLISTSKRFHLFYKKNLLFLFYTITFTKHLHQLVYFTRYFNKIFILHQFFLLFSLMVILF